jgi:hypothetical protein
MEVVMGLLLVVLLVGVALATRKRPGRTYDEHPPGRAEADKDTWWYPG